MAPALRPVGGRDRHDLRPQWVQTPGAPYPSKTIALVGPPPAGGHTDAIARPERAAGVAGGAMPELREKLAASGTSVMPASVAEIDAFVRSEVDKWAGVIKAGNMRAE
jgi:tripartite-type tricarboxylate transporter receptor subunit TctC